MHDSAVASQDHSTYSMESQGGSEGSETYGAEGKGICRALSPGANHKGSAAVHLSADGLAWRGVAWRARLSH